MLRKASSVSNYKLIKTWNFVQIVHVFHKIHILTWINPKIYVACIFFAQIWKIKQTLYKLDIGNKVIQNIQKIKIWVI